MTESLTHLPTGPLKQRAPTRCQACGAELRRGLRELHSRGPCRAARAIGRSALPTGISLFVAVFLLTLDEGPLYGATVGGLAFVVLVAALYRVADGLPRSWRFVCRQCGWVKEVEEASVRR